MAGRQPDPNIAPHLDTPRGYPTAEVVLSRSWDPGTTERSSLTMTAKHGGFLVEGQVSLIMPKSQTSWETATKIHQNHSNLGANDCTDSFFFPVCLLSVCDVRTPCW